MPRVSSAEKAKSCETDGERLALLTQLQKDVLIYRSKGMQVREIAKMTDRSWTTINDHTKTIHKVLGVSNAIEAAVIAAKAGLV
jgi:DNA-binding NarL/FixJ family response regulator